MKKIYTYAFWYENQEKYDKPYIVQTTITPSKMQKIAYSRSDLQDEVSEYENEFDNVIIKKEALKIDPNYKEIKIDAMIEY